MKTKKKLDIRTLVDLGELHTRKKKQAERVISECSGPILDHAKRARGGADTSSIRVPGHKSVATVVFATRLTWNSEKLSTLRGNVGSVLDKYFTQETQFKPTEELEALLACKDASMSRLRKAIADARVETEIAPAVRFQS